MDGEQAEVVLDRVAQLGEPTARFTVGKTRLVRNLLTAILLTIVGAAIIALAFFLGVAHFHLWKIYILGPLLLVAGVMLVVRAYRNLGLYVLVFPEGVVRVCRDDVQAFFWEEIAKLWQKRNAFNWAYAWQGGLVYAVHRNDGTGVSFDDSLPQLKELGQILQRETLPHLLPKAVEAYDEGRTLDFVKLRLSQLGLGQGAESVPWSEIKTIRLNDEDLTIFKRSKWGYWLHMNVSDIPNFHILRALLEHRSPVKPTTH